MTARHPRSLRWRDWPLAVKLAVLLVGVAILPLGLVTLVAEITSRREVIAESRTRILQRAHSTAALLDRYLDDVTNDVNVVAMAPVTVAVLEHPEDPAQLQLLRSTLQVAQRAKRLEILSVLDSEGTVVASSDPSQEGRNRIATPYFLWANAGQARVHEPRYTPGDERVEINVSVPVRSADKRILGVAVTRLSLDEIDRLVASDSAFGGLNEYGMLWDERGIVLSSPARASRRFRPLGRLQPFTRDRMVAERRFGPSTALLLDGGIGGERVVEHSRWRMYDPAGSDPFDEVTLDGVPLGLASVSLDRQRWTYAVAAPTDAILAAVHVQGERNLLVAAGAALLALLLSLGAAGWVSRPLGRVRSAATALAAGDMSVRARLERRDEIGDMAEAFDQMADALSDKDAELRRYAEELERRVQARTADLQRSEERTQFLSRVGTALASSLDQDSIAETLARRSLPVMGSFCMVDLADRTGVQCAGIAATDPEIEKRLRAMRAEFPVTRNSPSPALHAIRTGESRVFNPEEATTMRDDVARNERHRQVLETFGPVSGVVVPLVARGERLGAMTFGDFGGTRRYGEVDVVLAHEMAYRAAVALENSRLYRELQESSRLKDEFLGVVSHELRTPLNALLGWVHVLRRGGLDDGQANRALESVERNARAQAQLVEDLLDTSRVISGKLSVAFKPTDVGALVEGAVESFRPLAFSRGVKLLFEVAPDLPVIEADAGRLQQVVGNLLSNALKFTPADGSVTASAFLRGPDIELRVVDTGVGIASEFLPYVFERFRQADSTTTRAHGGLGIGLAIARHLVELHGGTIRAESEGENRGSAFIVRIPATTAHISGRGEVEVPVARVPLHGLSVLVVDDESDARELLRAAFEEAGARVTTVSGAEEAIAMIEADRPHVLVSDIGLPGRDGYFLIRHVRESEQGHPHRRVAAVAVSAYARDEDYLRSVRAGFDRHLAKPIVPVAVVTAVQSVLSSRGMQQGA